MKGLVTGVGGKTNFEEDIQASCLREILEETGLTAHSINLKAVVKTLLENEQTSWLLFVYTSSNFSGQLKTCNEGRLFWQDINTLQTTNLIGFIRSLLPYIFSDIGVFEGTIVHDKHGKVIETFSNQPSTQ
jgi:8-oxo-dGTP diphosphatase